MQDNTTLHNGHGLAAIRQLLDSHSVQAICSVADVARVLRQLDTVLTGSALDGLRNFNTTYLMITEHVQHALSAGVFQHPAFLHKFDSCFAGYYLQALRGYLNRQPIPPAWQSTFEAALYSSASPLKIMALGVNAHVNNDIPQVLIDTQAQAEHRADYRLVNRIIDGALDDVFDSLQSFRSILNPDHGVVRAAYKPATMLLVRAWRGSAWHKFQRMHARKLSVNWVEERAFAISRSAWLLS